MVEITPPVKVDENVVTSNDSVLNPEYEVWKPNRTNPTFSNLTEEEKKTLFLYRNVNSILNKLTPETFIKLATKMKQLPVDTSEKMQEVVEIIHKKSVNEWKFRALYAKLCNFMGDIRIIENKTVKTFSSCLVNYCEAYFEKSLLDEIEFERRKCEIDNLFDQKLKKTLLKKYESKEYFFRKLSVGNCQFIGELFKFDLISQKTIIHILDSLFKVEKIMAIECFCAILTITGQFYEEKYETLPTEYFDKICSLSQRRELPPRIRFLLEDLQDLKKNSWKPRILLELPKTLQQIKQEMDEENENQMKLTESLSRKKRRTRSKCTKNEPSSLSSDEVVIKQEVRDSSYENSEVENSKYNVDIPLEESNYDIPSTSRDVQKPITRLINIELLKILKGGLSAFASNQLPKQCRFGKLRLQSDALPEAICTLIKYVLETAPKKSAICGHFFVSLIEQQHIPIISMIRGLSLLLNSVENEYVNNNLELIIKPLFFGGYLKLDDLDLIFNGDFKNESIKRENEEITSQHESEIKQLLGNCASNVPPKEEPFEESKSTSLSSDEVSCGASSESDIKSFEISPQIRKLLDDLHPRFYVPSIFRSELIKLFSGKDEDMENIIHYIIQLMLKKPSWCTFYVRVCSNMFRIKRCWIIVMKVCRNYMQKLFVDDHTILRINKVDPEAITRFKNTPQSLEENKKRHKEWIIFKEQKKKHEEMNFFCRFFAEIINTLNNEGTDATIKQIMRRLLLANYEEYFCEIYENLRWKQSRFEVDVFETMIPKILLGLNNELDPPLRQRLQDILDDFVSRSNTPDSDGISNSKKKRKRNKNTPQPAT